MQHARLAQYGAGFACSQYIFTLKIGDDSKASLVFGIAHLIKVIDVRRIQQHSADLQRFYGCSKLVLLSVGSGLSRNNTHGNDQE